MPKIRYLRIQFDQALSGRELPMFRAAVIEQTHRESDLFHNHTEDGGFVYRYPLIQYKVSDGKAGMVCLNQGTDDIHYLLQNRQLDFRIGKEHRRYAIEDIRLNYFEPRVLSSPVRYRINNWLPFNQENYKEYMQLPYETDRLQRLEGILVGNIISFAKGITWQIEERIQVRLLNKPEERVLNHKGQPHIAFTADFDANVALPEYIGLGRGTSVGFGMLRYK